MEYLFTIGAILLLAGFIQGITGFGSALIAIPLLCLIMDIKLAIPLSVLASLLITSTLSLKLKTHLDGSKLLPLCLATLPGIMLGVTILKKVRSETIALLLGMLIISYSLYNLLRHPAGGRVNEKWAYFAGFTSGAIGSAFSAGGPPVIIYTAMTGWSKDTIKATMTGFFLFNSIMIACAHAITAITTREVFISFLFSSPFLLAGTLAGSFCYQKLTTSNYLKSIYFLLILMGIMMILLKT